MKPAAIINRGPDFVTLRATTECPAELREALAARDVQHVFKGDQNQAWDAVVANHCLARAVGDDGVELTFFVQDERLGTADARLARHLRREGVRYALTEDYYRGRAGAVWEHQDVSQGLFYTEAVSPEQFAAAGIHLPLAARLWQRYAPELLADDSWLGAMAALGVTFPGGPCAQDAATGLGPAVHPALLARLAAEDPAAALYQALTRSDGLYGIVPTVNDNLLLSSIPAADPELLRLGGFLLRRAARGALRLAASPAHRRQVLRRARDLHRWAASFLADRPTASVADFQEALGCWLTRCIFPNDQLALDRSSRFTRVAPQLPPPDSDPGSMLLLFDLALRHPAEFAAAYNDALNALGFGLQRVRYQEETGRFTPPFFVELAPRGPGTPVYRYGIELLGTTVRLVNEAAGPLEWDAGRPLRSAAEFVAALYTRPEAAAGVSIIGKAATFAAELQRAPRGLGLPRQGSKYAPMVDHLVARLRARGVLRQPTGLLIRIGLNALDRLGAMGETVLVLPAFLRAPLGERATCAAVAAGWRRTAEEARSLLELLGRCEPGQQAHLARLLLSLAGAGEDPPGRARPRLARLRARLASHPQAALLPRLAAELPPAVREELQRLLRRREELLAAREALTRAARRSHRVGRLVPDPHRRATLEQQLGRQECALLLLMAALVRRLWQRAESLPYVNDRPYTLALYLLFGPDIFAPICRGVEFDVEYPSPALAAALPEAAPCACGC